ncbi:uncharacterized protein PG986_010289 [Apiospora aurea]|uniref:Cyanovirin-N domain-containing protein n=1 Tax=Apiospora aurea TaxID=335848 RepID=A0ABR1QA60_9PEZI
MSPSGSLFTATVAAIMAMMMAMLVVNIALPVVTPAKRGIGWLYDHCDDDWSIMPPYYFVGKCDARHPPDARTWLTIDLTGCYTVTDDGELSVDNQRVGGMGKRCDRCTRCSDLDKDVCMMCVCNKTDNTRHWAVKDLDDDLFDDVDHDRIFCGEWWGGPYCGYRGLPPKPAIPGQAAYIPTLWP